MANAYTNLANLNTNQNQISFSFTNPVKFDRSNYMIWKSQVLASIRGNHLEGFINGTKIAPIQFITRRSADGTNQQVENPEFAVWSAQDQTLLGWLLSSISEGTLSLVINLNTSFDVWRALERQFGAQSKARVLQLRYQMNTSKKDAMSIEDYCVKMKSLADKLACAGSAMTDDDLMMHILSGLGTDCFDVATFITESSYMPGAANAASYEGPADEGWYLDSGATHYRLWFGNTGTS